jgi:molybdopterin/thiamine biosynthesis adenylyltransferase
MEPPNMLRYSRQLMIPEIGFQGQLSLLNSKVLVIGTGGLGSPVLLYLAAAGIGTIGIADFDRVDLSNLQRQILFSQADIGKSKTETAAAKLLSLNSDIKINALSYSISKDNVLDTISGYDIVVDASDNFLTRYILNDACYLKKIPLIYGSLFRLEGQISVFNLNEHAPCYRCLYPSPPPGNMIPTCSEGGALGSIAGLIGSIQATECVKILLKKGTPLSGKVMHINLFDLDVSFLSVQKSPSCLICNQQEIPEILSDAWYEFEGLSQICTRIKQISSKELIEVVKNSPNTVRLINVKEVWENVETLSGLEEISMPLSIIEDYPESLIAHLAHEGLNVFYCSDGSRSEHAIAILESEFGCTNLFNFKGSLSGLIAQQ